MSSKRQRKTKRVAAGLRVAVEAVPSAPATRRDKLLLAATLSLSFLAPFVFYLFTLAPTVTLEDSGELIAAAYNWGIPHSPGYPLFTMLGKLFTLLPFGDIAWRVNLMSAVLSSLGCLFVGWATLLLIDELRCGRRLLFPTLAGWSGILACASALSAAILAGTARSVWEQSVITEVYGLNSAFVGLLLLLAVLWGRAGTRRSRVRIFYAICLTFGLALTNHTTILLLLPVFAIYALAIERRLRPRLKQAGVGLALFVAGLLPYLYLPIASRRDPLLDWGNPENLTNFWRTVSRRQYGTELNRDLQAYLSQLEWFLTLLWRQWLPVVVLVVALAGLALLVRRRLRFAWFALLFLLVTGPLTTYVTNFPINVTPELLKTDNQALVSVFYLPFYLMGGLLAGIGFWRGGEALAELVRRRPGTARSAVPILVATAVVALALPLASALRTLPAVDMSDYRFAQAYIHNIAAVTTPDALVMGDRDQWVFPLMYSSLVLKENPGVMYVDQELLRRSWYIQMLRDHYPEVMAAIEPQADAFLEAVAPFEAGEAYSSDQLQRTYVAMVNGLMDSFVANGREVFLTYQPEPDIVAGYQAEPLPSAWRLVDPKAKLELTEAPLDRFDFAHLTDRTVPIDRNADYLRDYYAGLLQARGRLFEQIGRQEEAAQLNQLGTELLQAD